LDSSPTSLPLVEGGAFWRIIRGMFGTLLSRRLECGKPFLPGGSG
jgi:hypothetical protein